jgi:hypothetical protein
MHASPKAKSKSVSDLQFESQNGEDRTSNIQRPTLNIQRKGSS